MAAETTLCRHCGTNNPAENFYCNLCGNRLAEAHDSVSTKSLEPPKISETVLSLFIAPGRFFEAALERRVKIPTLALILIVYLLFQLISSLASQSIVLIQERSPIAVMVLTLVLLPIIVIPLIMMLALIEAGLLKLFAWIFQVSVSWRRCFFLALFFGIPAGVIYSITDPFLTLLITDKNFRQLLDMLILLGPVTLWSYGMLVVGFQKMIHSPAITLKKSVMITLPCILLDYVVILVSQWVAFQAGK